MASKPTIGVDLDGCVVNWADSAVLTLREAGHLAPSPERWDGWNYLRDNTSDEGWKWLWRAGKRDMFAQASPYPGALAALKFLERRFRVAFITNRSVDIADTTLMWLATCNLRPHAVIHVEGYKSGYLDCVAYVEDRPSNVGELVASTSATVHVPVRPWNRDSEIWREERVRPFHDWNEIVEWARKGL